MTEPDAHKNVSDVNVGGPTLLPSDAEIASADLTRRLDAMTAAEKAKSGDVPGRPALNAPAAEADKAAAAPTDGNLTAPVADPIVDLPIKQPDGSLIRLLQPAYR